MAITNTYLPNKLTPAYNPVVFAFTSNNYNKPGFRYVVDVFSGGTATKLGGFRVVPQIDGSGYIDISRILASNLSVDFTDSTNFGAAPLNSQAKYDVKLGEEYSTSWNYTDFLYYVNPSSIYNGYIKLPDLASATTHTYVVGDQIIVDTIPTGVTATVNGLHTVVAVIDPYTIVIDDNTGSLSGPVISGSTTYADGRKTLYSGLTNNTGYTAFNGALSFKDFPSYSLADYAMTGTSTTRKFLTNLPDNFYMTLDQDMWLNVATMNSQTNAKYLKISGYKANNVLITTFNYEVGTYASANTVTQLGVGPSNLNNPTILNSETEYYTFQMTTAASVATSKEYKVYIDQRCKIEDYEIAFMDRLGSIASYAFQLRATENGTIKRDDFKQKLGTETSYRTYDRGTTPLSVDVTKQYTLNTNWMTDEMSVYFEELLTSPYTWLKVNGTYLACIVTESSFEVTRQKNKNLIRKTITVTLANDNPINI